MYVEIAIDIMYVDLCKAFDTCSKLESGPLDG